MEKCKATNGSKVLIRERTEVWEEAGKVHIPTVLTGGIIFLTYTHRFLLDAKSSNGTFIGERLSPEGIESEPFELKSNGIAISQSHF